MIYLAFTVTIDNCR